VTVTNTGNIGERVLVKITWLGHPPAVEQRTVRLPFGATMQVRFRLHASASVRKLLQGGCEYSAVVTGVFGTPRRLQIRLRRTPGGAAGQDGAFARVAGEPGGALELGARLRQAAEPGEQVAADARQEGVVARPPESAPKTKYSKRAARGNVENGPAAPSCW